MSSAARRAFTAAAATFTLFAMAIGLSGCPAAAPLEDPDRFPALTTATGGTGNGGSGGSGGGGDDCRRPLPNVECNWRAALGARGQVGYCYKGGCHNAGTAAGTLDLTTINEDMTEDLFFISRLLNRPAAHEITCGATEPCVTMAAGGPTCADCAMCTPDQRLIDTTNPGTGFLFDKIEAFIPGTTTTTMDIGCGDAMPTYNTPGTANYTQAHKDCLIQFFTEIAKTPGTWPCGQSGGTGGSGGSGMSGSGGVMAGSGGASSAGTGGI